jgi:molybdopterin molybdotransferase
VNLASIQDVWASIYTNVTPLQPVATPLNHAHHSVLRQDVVVHENIPPFNRSPYDGFAVAEGETSNILEIASEVRPGDAPPDAPPDPGKAWRIFTGTALPEGTEVLMQEDTKVEGKQLKITSGATRHSLRKAGAYARSGEKLAASGEILSANTLSLCAAIGLARPLVSPIPRVAHLTTGSEIVPAEATPRRGQIRDSNGPLVFGMVRETGGQIVGRMHSGESLDESFAQLQSLERIGFHLLLISGGASVGKHDITRALLEKAGFQILVAGVDVRPGKPFLLAKRNGQIAAGLPGNPLSHFVSFHLFVRPILDRLSGLVTPPLVPARLLHADRLESDRRPTYWPAMLCATQGNLEVEPLKWSDSGDFISLRRANALIPVPASHEGPAPSDGDLVSVLLCRRAFM